MFDRHSGIRVQHDAATDFADSSPAKASIEVAMILLAGAVEFQLSL
jgi:hypothetical protein